MLSSVDLKIVFSDLINTEEAQCRTGTVYKDKPTCSTNDAGEPGGSSSLVFVLAHNVK